MSPLCSVYNRMKCLLIGDLFGQIENILHCEHVNNEDCFLMDFPSFTLCYMQVLQSASSVTSHHSPSVFVAPSYTHTYYSSSSLPWDSWPCSSARGDASTQACWPACEVLHVWLKSSWNLLGWPEWALTLQPFCWGFSVHPFMSSSKCVVSTMLVKSHYVLDLCILDWNWFLVKKQSHKNQNMTSKLNFSCTLMISSSSGVCIHGETAGLEEDSLWAGLVCITGVPLYKCAKDPWKPPLYAELCFPLNSVILWILASLPFLLAWVVLHTSAKPFTYLTGILLKKCICIQWAWNYYTT